MLAGFLLQPLALEGLMPVKLFWLRQKALGAALIVDICVLNRRVLVSD